MEIKKLRRYSNLYRSARYLGADAIFKKFLDLHEDDVVPVSIAHGVDLGHCYEPMDIFSPEPIHWSCNSAMHARANRIKPSLQLPHPWVIRTGNLNVPKGRGTLLIGPPPGPANDSALHSIAKGDADSEWSVLIKPRGNIRGSVNFWRQMNITPVSLDTGETDYFLELAKLIGGYRRVVSGTFSSVLIFAAALGRDIGILPGFVYKTFERANYEDEVNLNSSETQALAKIFTSGRQAEIQESARRILGYDLAANRIKIATAYREVLHQLQKPLWDDPSLLLPFRLRAGMALVLKKPGMANVSWKSIANRLSRNEVAIMTMSEFDLWRNGKSDKNFRLERVRYVPGLTVPGMAAEGYAE